MYDLIIIGTGVAGLSAAIYAGRYRMNVLLVGDHQGGETAIAGKIENYPGAPDIDGFDLVETMRAQAKALGAEFASETIDAVEHAGHCFVVKAGAQTHQTSSILIATGTERRKLGLPNEKELTGKGVHYCVTCDGPLYSRKTIAMVGGGDASVKGMNLAAEYVSHAYLIVRDNELHAEPINAERLKNLGDKITVLYETEVKEIVGSAMLNHIVLSKPINGSATLAVDGLFIEIGAQPHVEFAKALGVELDEHDYIKTDAMMRTNVDGVFAAGDIVNLFGSFKQAITAAAMGAVAATSAYEDHKIHGELCRIHNLPERISRT